VFLLFIQILISGIGNNLKIVFICSESKIFAKIISNAKFELKAALSLYSLYSNQESKFQFLHLLATINPFIKILSSLLLLFVSNFYLLC
jgi:hypothetical protein